MKQSANHPFGSFPKGALEDVFETLADKPKEPVKKEDPKWPSVRVKK